MATQVLPAKQVFWRTTRLTKLMLAIGVAFGITTICLFWLVDPLISSTHDAIYHWNGSWFQLFAVPILDFCIFWLLLALVLYFARGRVRITIWCGIIALTPWIEVNNWSYLSHKYIPFWLSALVLGLGIFAFPLLLALWRSKFEEKFKRVEEFATAVFICSACCGVLILSRYAWIGWQARSLNVKLALHNTAYDRPAQAQRSRVIWILFDELSYQQVYGRRFPDLQLPAFDALAAQSTVFTHTVPAGARTETILPSLLTSKPVDDIWPSANGRQFKMHGPHSSVWQRFDEHDTVFQDALKLNYRTAIAGWYNPYCRILPDVLDNCFWTYALAANNTMAPKAALGSNLIQPWMHFFRERLGYKIASLFLHVSGQNDIDAGQHISDYIALTKAADQILENQSAGFVLIHMPIPHPKGIYDRTSDRFASAHSDYLDNVVLADKFLGHVRSKLEQSGEWDTSTLVVMGDHSWRSMWRDTPEWTEEEQIASQNGQFDDRPAYIVKLPEQHAGARIDVPFAAINTRRLFDSLLAQKIRSKQELAAWAIQFKH
ncbi:MAG TPA: sulfatase-like hydrolase/transferase [Edaphobacter sp.]|jgi:hypothetical protein|nr:sulfatase-like hydrolase/transferase [Edaphobacter sp.]